MSCPSLVLLIYSWMVVHGGEELFTKPLHFLSPIGLIPLTLILIVGLARLLAVCNEAKTQHLACHALYIPGILISAYCYFPCG